MATAPHPSEDGARAAVASARPPRIEAAGLHESVGDPVLTSMTLLNEIAGRFPDAVSFAAGRPYEGFYDTRALAGHLRTFEDYLRGEAGLTDREVTRAFFQYGRTKGIIHELIARHLANDEGLRADPEDILVTTGCQEAMVLVLRALCRDRRDVVLTSYPSYVGFLGAARLVGMPVHGVREGATGIDVDDLTARIRRARAKGLRPRACYVVPDFANPSGATMTTADRRRLLEVAAQEDILLLEDNPYSMFRLTGSRPPTLKSLDRDGRVVYLGSFAKTAFAGARIGYVVAEQPVADGSGGSTRFVDELAKLKSMLTLNTSTVAQAVIGGYLLEHGCSVEKASVREAAVYRENLRHLLGGLTERFGEGGADGAAGKVSWNTPNGGMFAVLSVPFRADRAMLEYSASRFGVLWTPMEHFYAGTGGQRQLRLSYSVLSPERISTGLDRLAALVRDRA
ncbi:PLP-dependent aminotransferase family protein [Kitasatospora aureofaciens]|uniref:PLP-dependent aminotransferase family protein n=1 Tax=Kitasatospora aureofaciens TaxID=1894 RepID=UPI0037C57F86